jgi:uncharacterized membrane protein
MTPNPIVQHHAGWHITPKHLLFGLLGAFTIFVICHNERFIIDHSDPQWAYYLPVRWLLIPHGIAGTIALVLGASQFSTRLRERHARVHRMMGRSYVIAVAIAAPMGIYVTLARNELPLQIAVITQAALWMLATAVAFYCIRRRNFQQHRHWMIRSYAITTIFVTDRMLDAIPGMGKLDTDASPNVTWLCNIIAWVIPTLIIAWPNIFPPRDNALSAR